MSERPQSPGDGDDGPATAGQAEREQQQPPLVVQAQYVKDLSFEVPGAPAIFGQLQRTKPNMQVRVEVQSHALGQNVHEVVLNIRAECKAGDAIAFVLELAYGGVFGVNIAAEAVTPVLMIECPRLLFPFARQIVAATTLDGGFLPLMLAPIDFVGLYQRQMQADKREAETPAPDTLLA
jgi:preprotein translocase subunit SecB